MSLILLSTWRGWVGWLAHKTLLSALVPIGIGIRGLGLGLDKNSIPNNLPKILRIMMMLK